MRVEWWGWGEGGGGGVPREGRGGGGGEVLPTSLYKFISSEKTKKLQNNCRPPGFW